MDKEHLYINHFYTKHKGRISIGVGYNSNMTEIFPFVFENTKGESVGIVALGTFLNGDKGVHIYHLGAFITQQGFGTVILKELCRQADIQNIILSVSAVPMKGEEGLVISYEELASWYKNYGFSGEENLLRYPSI